MSTAVETPPFLVASFTNERLGLCANVREVRESEEHELLVVDAFSGEVTINMPVFENLIWIEDCKVN
jgi:hypothetical protein